MHPAPRFAGTAAAFALLLAASGSGAGASTWAPAERFPHTYTLADARIAHWAPVLRTVVAHRRPDAASPRVATVGAVTAEWTQNVVLVLRGIDLAPGRTWYEVRLAILPNSSTGWLPRSALGNLYAVHTHLYVNRANFTARLERDGRTIFTARVGVGRPTSPTPVGEFYVRDEVRGFDDPFYGPVAFGTSARAAALTDWPGGDFIGIHGTDDPAILPGRVSHGCIRMVNGAILRLSKLMDVGTPVTVT